MTFRRLTIALFGVALGAYAQQSQAGPATPERSQSIELTPASPTVWESATIVAPGRGLHKYSIYYIDTRQFRNGGLLSVSIQISDSSNTDGSFDIFSVQADRQLGKSLAGKYDIRRGSSTLLEYRFDRGEVFALTLEGNWFSPKGSTGEVRFTASVSGQPAATNAAPPPPAPPARAPLGASSTANASDPTQERPPILRRAPTAPASVPPPTQEAPAAASRNLRLKEVTDWLSSKLSSSTARSYRKTQGSSLIFANFNEGVGITFDGCRMTVRAAFGQFYSYPGGSTTTDREGSGTIDFKEFNFVPFQTGVDDALTSQGYVPEARHWPWVSPGPGRYYVVPGSGTQTSSTTGSVATGSNSSQALSYVMFNFYAETDDLPNRIRTAVTELRQLCGGKEEPF